ncbi:hypothetical protein DRF60_03960 [Chryseobacterium elymi]|uniref:Uncharacterized protein n=2 Tax=Chryseobacterium elymi TaxID=395936 RepID=A0A3D9DP26_9FLAO|nr:hypothetical protein DRF60_03960 [Chryseobacterium elymi]
MPAFTHNVGGGISSHLPINHFMLEPGLQNIKINVLPLKGEDSLRPDGFITIKVFSYDASTENYDNTVEAFKFEKLDFSQNKMPGLNLTTDFKADINYQITGWKISEPFNTVAFNQYEIEKYFRFIHGLFKERDIEGLYKEMKDRFDEIDISMYLGIVDNKMELSKLFGELSGGKFILEDFPDSTEAKFFANAKVCTLVGAEEKPIIHYTNKETNEEYALPLFIHKKGGKYNIIR